MTHTPRRAVVFSAFLMLLAVGDAVADGSATLLGQYSMPDPGQVTDVWGYVDPATNREYALVGEWDRSVGVVIVDVTEPANPTFVANAPDAAGFDMKVWDKYLYVVTGSPATNGGRIFDLSDISTPTYVGAFDSAHNIFIDDRGYMYSSLAGPDRELRIYDLNADPTSPRLIWWDGLGEPHDSYVAGTTLYDFHGPKGTRIYDVTVPQVPILLGVVADGSFHHSGMPTADGKHVFVTHELNVGSKPDITVWNIENPGDPVLVAEIFDPEATVHNLYIIGDFAYVSYYTAGFRVYDVSDPAQPELIDEYDTTSLFGEAWVGAWGVFPFTPSGNIYVSDTQNGLFVFSFTERETPTLITAFDANYVRGAVRIEWRVNGSNGLLGFNAYRSDSPAGNFRRLNNALIPPVQDTHVYEDEDVEPGKDYWYRMGLVTAEGETFSRTQSVRIPLPSFTLYDAAPNPFNPATTLTYELPATSDVELAIFNADGQRVLTLVNGARPLGVHTVRWDGRDDRRHYVASGVYFARLAAAGAVTTKRLVFLK